MSIDLEDLDASLEQLVELHGADLVRDAFARLCYKKADYCRAVAMNAAAIQRWIDIGRQIEKIDMSGLV